MLLLVPLHLPEAVLMSALSVRLPEYCAGGVRLLSLPLKEPVQSSALLAVGRILNVPLIDVPFCVTVAIIGPENRWRVWKCEKKKVPVSVPARLIAVRETVTSRTVELVKVTPCVASFKPSPRTRSVKPPPAKPVRL